MIGGIDLGGTKIEARVYDDALQEIARQRVPTPTGSYADLLDGLAAQVTWIVGQGDVTAIGLATPGVINPHTGVMLSGNLPATGHRLAVDISHKTGRTIAVINDCRAFALSEAIFGAGAAYRNVLGLIIGTGVAGGHVVDRRVMPDLNGQLGEFGHLPLPAQIVADYDLPLVGCGCGLTGCFETYLAGPGLVRLAQHMIGQTMAPEVILTQHPEVKQVWLAIAAALIGIISRTSDPEVIVLGGGLGMVPGLADELGALLPSLLFSNVTSPRILQAQHGDASGALGAAFYAQQQATS